MPGPYPWENWKATQGTMGKIPADEGSQEELWGTPTLYRNVMGLSSQAPSWWERYLMSQQPIYETLYDVANRLEVARPGYFKPSTSYEAFMQPHGPTGPATGFGGEPVAATRGQLPFGAAASTLRTLLGLTPQERSLGGFQYGEGIKGMKELTDIVEAALRTVMNPRAASYIAQSIPAILGGYQAQARGEGAEPGAPQASAMDYIANLYRFGEYGLTPVRG